MKTLIIKRVQSNKFGTYGVMSIAGNPLMLTLENLWKHNQKNISCIPRGTYICNRRRSPRFGETFEVSDVINRTHIIFHAGNTEDDTDGCILLGQKFGEIGGKTAILDSRMAMAEFLAYLVEDDKFRLTII